MKTRRAWLTPDAGNEGAIISRPLFIPLPLLPMVAGAIAELTRPENWQKFGSMSPERATELMSEMLYQWVDAGIGEMTLFRLTEDCAFEYSNDGETWLPVAGWAEFAAACFTGPQGPQGEQGPQGPQGPQGETGIVSIQEVYVDGDTQQRLQYDPDQRKLTVTFAEQWLRGIRVIPSEVPSDLSGHAIQLQTYDDPDQWVTLGFIPPYGTVGYIDPEPVTVSDAAIACGMATRLMEKLYANWEQSLEVLDQAEDIAEAVGEFIETFNVVIAAIPFSLIVDGITTAFSVAASAMAATFTPTNYEELLEQLYCRLLAGGSFDGDAIADWVNWILANYSPLTNIGVWWFGTQVSWTNVQFMKRHALIGALDPLETCQFYECSGPAEWAYTVDFTSSSGLWVMNPSFGAGAVARVDGVGWPSASGGEGGGAYRSQELILLTPGGYNPDLTLTQVKITYEVVDGTPTHPAAAYNIGMLLIQGAGASPDHLLTPPEDSPYAETERTLTFDHPGYTGVYSVIWRLFATSTAPAIVVKSITVKGLGDNPYV